MFLLGSSFLAALALGGEARLRPVVGSERDFARVTHVVIEGSSFEIGRELARLGQERHGCEPGPARDPARVRAQRAYFAERFPTQLERMRGAAEFFGLELAADEAELSELAYGQTGAGCTVVFYPPATTESGQGVLSRNFDFTTGTLAGRAPGPGETAVCAAPYVLELHPSDAFASLALVAFDLFGVVDGINSEGLTVALLADDELSLNGQARPTPGPQAGLDVLQVGRFLLDTCQDVPEAQVALRESRLYYGSIPCHYLVADREGRAFIWENELDLSGGHVIELGQGPLVSTNYLRHLHPDELPEDENPLGLFGRERTLCARFAGQGQFSLEEMRANASQVSPRASSGPGFAPGRTLWHALYFPAERRVELDFYLGEGAAPGAVPRRSAVQSFSLAGAGAR